MHTTDIFRLDNIMHPVFSPLEIIIYNIYKTSTQHIWIINYDACLVIINNHFNIL